ncbi:MAG TPA: hypothetical protein HPP65_07110 [Gammaproteobacteria bacterium]|nr:hypothetical protein [Gammaproteobacteria bacterium]MBT3719036.1 hypothetical protein [Gammaproteobacteria bacterium]MBT4549487.1 hypothetical protein [Gammaproteobacteria bacterium]MBT5371884.1 hypothetical protein [Gammaproteobacteria bacterium]MBT7478510.1 hypothetical protein [Gammaproteobacteria bacterium]
MLIAISFSGLAEELNGGSAIQPAEDSSQEHQEAFQLAMSIANNKVSRMAPAPF